MFELKAGHHYGHLLAASANLCQVGWIKSRNAVRTLQRRQHSSKASLHACPARATAAHR